MECWEQGGFESEEEQSYYSDSQQRYETEHYEAIKKEDSNKLLTALAIKEILKDSESVIKEFEDDVKLYYTNHNLVNESEGVTFDNYLTLNYTMPKQLTKKDYLENITKAEEKLAKAKELYDEFLNHGCETQKSKPQLRFGTTNKRFKEILLIRKIELLKQLPALNDIRQFVKKIDS